MTEDKLHSIVMGVLLALAIIEIGRHKTWKSLWRWEEEETTLFI